MLRHSFLCIIVSILFQESIGFVSSLNLWRSQTRLQLSESAEYTSIVEGLVSSTNGVEKLFVGPLFASFATSESFLKSVWQRKPFLCDSKLDNLVDSFTMKEVQEAVDNDFIEAGRGTPIPGGGWNMASVSQPRGKSFDEAKLRFEDVQMAMKQTAGTIVFNSAGGFIPPLAGVCLETISSFDLPAALNMYLTSPGQKLSAPPHTDRQEVFVLQTQGQKRWRVFAPPAPSNRPKADPFARGKGKDELSLSELAAEPLIDTVLNPGQVLYIPAGFPHTTDTVEGITNTVDPSVHLTVGLDSHVWGLSFAGLRSYSLRRQGLEHELPLAKLDASHYWELQDSLPLGFLSEEIVKEHKGYGTGMRQALTAEIISRLIARMRRVEKFRWAMKTDDEIAQEIGAEEATARMLTHHRTVTEILRKMYADVAFKMTPTKMDLSFFRSQPYFQQLETAMEDLENWASPKNKAAEIGKSKGFSGGFKKS